MNLYLLHGMCDPLALLTGTRYCYGGVQSDTGFNYSVIGDVFLKSQFVVFDVGGNRVGFAQQA